MEHWSCIECVLLAATGGDSVRKLILGAVLVAAGVGGLGVAEQYRPLPGGYFVPGVPGVPPHLSQTAYDLVSGGAWLTIAVGVVIGGIGVKRLWHHGKAVALGTLAAGVGLAGILVAYRYRPSPSGDIMAHMPDAPTHFAPAAYDLSLGGAAVLIVAGIVVAGIATRRLQQRGSVS